MTPLYLEEGKRPRLPVGSWVVEVDRLFKPRFDEDAGQVTHAILELGRPYLPFPVFDKTSKAILFHRSNPLRFSAIFYGADVTGLPDHISQFPK